MIDPHVDVVGTGWVIMAHLLVLAAISSQAGRFGSTFGRVRMYQLWFGVFTLGSIRCGLSGNGGQLTAFRVLQGIGGAFLGSSRLPDALSAAFAQGMRSVWLAANPPLAIALTRSLVRLGAKARRA